MTSLTFGLDYDGTFTACPELWGRFIKDAESLGHRVIIVTARHGNDHCVELIREDLKAVDCVIPQIHCSMGSKIHATKERGIDVDIWIDNDPDKIARGH